MGKAAWNQVVRDYRLLVPLDRLMRYRRDLPSSSALSIILRFFHPLNRRLLLRSLHRSKYRRIPCQHDAGRLAGRTRGLHGEDILGPPASPRQEPTNDLRRAGCPSTVDTRACTTA